MYTDLASYKLVNMVISVMYNYVKLENLFSGCSVTKITIFNCMYIRTAYYLMYGLKTKINSAVIIKFVISAAYCKYTVYA